MPYSIDRYSSNLFDPSVGFPINIPDNAINSNATSLKLVGRRVTNYGEIMAENVVHLLENFAGVAAPTNPITGQLWWEQDPANPNASQKLHIFNGTTWKSVSGSTVAPTAPTGPQHGDFWYDTTNQKLYVYQDSAWVLVYTKGAPPTNPGPTAPTPSERGMLWYSTTNTNLHVNNGAIWEALLKARPNSTGAEQTYISYDTIAGNEVIIYTVHGRILAIWAAAQIPFGSLWNGTTPAGQPNLQSLFPNGLNVGLNYSNVAGNGFSSNNNTVNGVWTLAAGARFDATYADLGERYHADAAYPAGTIVRIGGANEVTQTTTRGDIEVFGVVSDKPAYILNAAAGTDETHPVIAMVGRTPVRVVGPVVKGQYLISGDVPGTAVAIDVSKLTPNEYSRILHATVGRALENKETEGEGLVEATVGVK